MNMEGGGFRVSRYYLDSLTTNQEKHHDGKNNITLMETGDQDALHEVRRRRSTALAEQVAEAKLEKF